MTTEKLEVAFVAPAVRVALSTVTVSVIVRGWRKAPADTFETACGTETMSEMLSVGAAALAAVSAPGSADAVVTARGTRDAPVVRDVDGSSAAAVMVTGAVAVPTPALASRATMEMLMVAGDAKRLSDVIGTDTATVRETAPGDRLMARDA